jgi:hypothetical protein
MNFVFISKEYCVTYDKGRIKMFRQECHTLPLLHGSVLHCKIFPTCNTWHIFSVPCAIKHFEAIRPYISIQATFTSSSCVQVFWQKPIQGKIPCSLQHFDAVTLLPRPPLWSSGQSSWLQIRRPGFDSRHYQKRKGSGTESTQPREYNWGATW